MVLARFSPDHVVNQMDVDGCTPTGSIDSIKGPNTDLCSVAKSSERMLTQHFVFCPNEMRRERIYRRTSKKLLAILHLSTLSKLDSDYAALFCSSKPSIRTLYRLMTVLCMEYLRWSYESYVIAVACPTAPGYSADTGCVAGKPAFSALAPDNGSQ